jgi:hypothetical protein
MEGYVSLWVCCKVLILNSIHLETKRTLVLLEFIHGCKEVGILEYHENAECDIELWRGKLIISSTTGNVCHPH